MKDNGRVGKRYTLSTTKTYEGKLCLVCNTTLKYNSTRGCIECTKKEARDRTLRFPQETKIRKQEYYKNNKDSLRDYKFRITYGISLAEYEELLKQQNNVCKICKQECKSGRKLSVDHSHTTEKVRGLLCLNCNRAIGNFNDDVVLLQKAIKYLNDYN